MYHESTQHKQNAFVTLTYAENPLHLVKRDLQLFFKRLRRHYKIRYFATGEYGSITHRPHYHAILFGTDFRGGAYNINDELYSNPYLDKAWGHGLVSVGPVTVKSIMYVAGYVTKKLGDPDTFNLMSRRPGIGKGWADKYLPDIQKNQKIAIEGREYPVPKRYISWHEDACAELTASRKAHFANLTPDQRLKRARALPNRELNYRANQSFAGPL